MSRKFLFICDLCGETAVEDQEVVPLQWGPLSAVMEETRQFPGGRPTKYLDDALACQPCRYAFDDAMRAFKDSRRAPRTE